MKFRLLVLFGLVAGVVACSTAPSPTSVPVSPTAVSLPVGATANVPATETAITIKVLATLTASAPQDTVTPPPLPNTNPTDVPAPTLEPTLAPPTLPPPTLVLQLSPSVTPIPQLPTRVPTRGPTSEPTQAPLVVSAEGLRGKILFKSTRSGGKYPGSPAYFVMDPDGTNVTPLPRDSALKLYQEQVSRAGYSPDGSLLVIGERTCSGNRCVLYIGPPELVVSRSQGEWATGPNYAAADQPVWSPDGGWIAFTWNRDNDRTKNIFKGDPSRQNQDYKRLTDFGGHADTKSPTYSPDGSLLAFATNSEGNHWQIWVLNALAETFGDAAAHPASPSEFDDWDPVWIK